MHPFTEIREKSAATIGETVLIARIREWIGSAAPDSPEGPGDDCAVWQPTPGERLLITTDPVVYGKHFDDRASPAEAAGKLLRRNLSDIAAMGGQPTAAVLSLFLPPHTGLEWLEAFHRGLAREAETWQVKVIGGDICASDGLLGASLTLFGETVGGRLLTRAGAVEGDRIAVTGALGGSLAGRHLRFAPRLAEGQWLARQKETVAMMDISDGLAKDLPAMIAPEWQARVETNALPVSPDAMAMAQNSGRAPWHHALCDGEDYELLIMLRGTTDPADFAKRWQAAGFSTKLVFIGQVIRRPPEGPPVLWLDQGQPVSSRELHGYEHLR